MKLQTLKLEHFQGLKSEEFKFNGNSASIYGDNATGKTTVFNAITWLLFDKASTGAKNYSPKTKGPDGDLHRLDHSAEAAFSLEDGRIVTLKKVYHENYKKKRGSATEDLDGHTVDYYIDGVPVKEKEYSSTLIAYCGGDVETMKMLTMPDYFPEEMTWDARRKILLEICGDVSDEDVMRSTDDLKGLRDYLLMPGTSNQFYTVDEYKKIAGAKKTEINKQLQGIPGRIDEAQRAMPNIMGLNATAIDNAIKSLANQKSDLEIERAQAMNGDLAFASLRNSIAEANAELSEARTAHVTQGAAANESIFAVISQAKQLQSKAKSSLQDAKTDFENVTRRINNLNQRRADLVNEYMAIQQETWDEGKETCPTCHQELPEESIQKLREDFNLSKGKRLENINARGQKEASKEIIEQLQATSKELEDQIAEYTNAVQDQEEHLAILQSQIKQPVSFESTEQYSLIMAKISSLRKSEEDKGATIRQLSSGQDDKIRFIQTKISEQEESKSKISIVNIQKERIKELEAQEKKLAAEYEQLEQGIYLCEVFIKTKVNMLTEKINDKFQNVRFRLFVEQQNGGVKEDCEVMIPAEGGRMVPFVFSNNAARINAGLEIIEALSLHWGITMPVFVDNAESVTKLLKMNTQVIRLVVSEADSKLRLEINN
ncbi:MAG TPA: AAA family ATPase [Clostridiaceae bacterium]